MEALGRLFNLATSATTGAVRVNMRDATGITFILIGATSGNATIQEHNAASSGTSQNLATITKYYRQNSGLWTEVTQAAAATFTAGTGGLAACYIGAAELSDGFAYLSASHASGSFVYILHDLQVQRDPASLAAVTA
ncbi:hypothetical protein [Micromonospora haikouensis]|uniref:hypothetical protein n=1 Tax=Micromonospora haikouensis TaxID=686309 RepID=UPI003D727C51